ncbi:MAG: AAA family ATPase [Acidobacteriota bacterium]|nr:AAA family ATPase [Acidobacteriota bacterium]
MEITIPERSIVLLMGISGSGKSTFGAAHFLETEVISSDNIRAMLADDASDQSVSKPAFEVLQLIVRRRLEAGRIAVVDATNLVRDHRKPFLELGKSLKSPVVVILLDMPEDLCRARQRERSRRVSASVIGKQVKQLNHTLPNLDREGFWAVYRLTGPQQVAEALIQREEPHLLYRNDPGPFDIIGDIHGCLDELIELLTRLGYRIGGGEWPEIAHPEGRKAIFLGDLVDRGPDSPGVLRLVMNMTASGAAYCVAGNHDVKFFKKISGHNVSVTYGLAETLHQMQHQSEAFHDEVRLFLDVMSHHYVLDGGKLVVAHAGLKENMHGLNSKRVWAFALFGETTGKSDENGLPIRYPWANDYRGEAMVVYGHTPVEQTEWINNTICVDTGCVFGGSLTALRYPERELVSVPAKRTYYKVGVGVVSPTEKQ